MPRTPKIPSAAPAPSGPRLVTKPTRTTPSDAPAPLHDDITRRAYELFLEDGAVHGRDVEHWLRAEQELAAAARPAKKPAASRARTAS